MHLSRTAEYALRAMTTLALKPDGEVTPVAALSEASAVPAAYLSKVMRRMVQAGLVTAQKGHGGGFALARRAADIPFQAVLEAAGVETEDHDCAFGFRRCDARNPCALHDAWKDLGTRFTDWSQGTTLADVRAAGRQHVARLVRK